MDILVLDFETFYDKDFSLSKITTEEYIRSPKFEVVGVAVKRNDEPTTWFSGDFKATRKWLQQWDIPNSAVCAQNAHFDVAILNWIYGLRPARIIDTLSMANVLHGVNESCSLSNLAKIYGIGEKGTEVIKAQGKRREDFSPLELSEYGAYCINDVDLTHVLMHYMVPQFPKKELKLIDLTVRMFTEPKLRLDKTLLSEALHQLGVERRTLILNLMRELGVKNEETLKKQLMSNEQFAQLLRENGVEPPTKISPTTGKTTYAFAKTDEEFTILEDHPNPTIQALFAARMGFKSTIGITRTEAFLSIAERGTFPFPLKYSGASVTHRWCLTGDHEVLTPNGWVRLDAWRGGNIMQFDGITKTMNYFDARPNEWDANENLIAFNERHHNALCTREHTLATKAHHTNRVSSTKAETLLHTKQRMIYVSGITTTPDNMKYSDNQLRLMVAMQADGYNVNDDKNNMVRFRFTRKHKIERIQYLLNKTGIPFTITNYESEPHVTVIRVRGRDAPEWLRASKELPVDWVNLSARQINVILDEVPRWDGSYQQGSSISFGSTNQDVVELYATLAHLVGRRAYISEVPRKERWSKAWSLYITHRNTTSTGHNVTEHAYIGKVYCPTTKTGFFLCRRGGVIFVTGNSGFDVNPQNLSRIDPDKPKPSDALRKAIIAPPGYKIVVADLSNIELRLGLWLAGQDDKLDLTRQGVDLYRDFAAQAYNVAYDSISKKDPARFVGKCAQLSLIFGTGAAKLQNTVRIQSKGMTTITENEAVNLTKLYRTGYNKVVDAWGEGSKVLDALLAGQTRTYLRNGVVRIGPAYKNAAGFVLNNEVGLIKPNGLVLVYPDLKKSINKETGKVEYTYAQRRARDKVYGSKVFQKCVQSLARDIMAEIIVSISKLYNVVGTVHDEVVLLVPEDHAEAALEDLLKIMRTPPVWAPDLPLDAEGGIGVSYGEAK